MKANKKRVVLVSGGSRGVGKGTALALSNENTVTYITGRSEREGQTSELPGTIHATASEVSARGGHCIAVSCDHNDDRQVADLVSQIMDEQGKLDILVNNVYQVPDDLLEWKPFWERPIDTHWQAMINLGVRAHYVLTHAAAGHMTKAKQGCIVTISSPAARAYVHSVIYGMGKAAKDKMMHDMAKELREFNVAAFALWPGIVKTERLLPALEAGQLPDDYQPLMSGMESAEFTGRVIDAIDTQSQAMQLTGRSWWNSELAKTLGVFDIDGSQPDSYAAFMGEPVDVPDAMIK